MACAYLSPRHGVVRCIGSSVLEYAERQKILDELHVSYFLLLAIRIKPVTTSVFIGLRDMHIVEPTERRACQCFKDVGVWAHLTVLKPSRVCYAVPSATMPA